MNRSIVADPPRTAADAAGEQRRSAVGVAGRVRPGGHGRHGRRAAVIDEHRRASRAASPGMAMSRSRVARRPGHRCGLSGASADRRRCRHGPPRSERQVGTPGWIVAWRRDCSTRRSWRMAARVQRDEGRARRAPVRPRRRRQGRDCRGATCCRATIGKALWLATTSACSLSSAAWIGLRHRRGQRRPRLALPTARGSVLPIASMVDSISWSWAASVSLSL